MARTVLSGASGGGSGTTLSPSTQNWATGTFGTGQLMTFAGAGSYTFVIPTNITSIRVRCFGAGGGGGNNVAYVAGAGGGFALGTFTVTAGSSHTVTVGAGGITNTAGGTSSFGSLISATGGAGGAANTSEKTGGNGSGGTVNYLGGGTQGNYSGGGGVACIFGPGNPGSYSNGNNFPSAYNSLGMTGGAGGGLGKNGTVYVSSIRGNSFGTFGMMITGHGPGNATGTVETSQIFYASANQPQCVDMLGTGPGGIADQGKGNGINGGGGAGGMSRPGRGGWPGGGGGAGGSTGSHFGYGADGCVVVEY